MSALVLAVATRFTVYFREPKPSSPPSLPHIPKINFYPPPLVCARVVQVAPPGKLETDRDSIDRTLSPLELLQPAQLDTDVAWFKTSRWINAKIQPEFV